MHELQPQGGSGRTADHAHEANDIRLRTVVIFAVGLVAALVVTHAAIRSAFSGYSAGADRRNPPRSPLREARLRPPEPRLQVHPGEELDALRKAEDEQLRTYGWVDRERKIVRIPIERAIDLVVRRGLPARAPQGKSE